ncbi:MAG: hypothetical protein EHM58_19375 [Ignavibacteriae bacterium]|nr:MAG: hypothetical protein EHM58_19375 [Ignavibacteriota bacterium]
MKKNYSLLFLTILFFFAHDIDSQILRGYGFKIGGSVANQTVSLNDEFINTFYKMPPGLRFYFNAAGFVELLNNKYVSGIAELSLNGKGANYIYDKKNENGVNIGTESLSNTLYSFSFSLNPKLRYQMKRKEIYIIAGPRVDVIFTDNIDVDFKKTYSMRNDFVFGWNAGIGLDISDFIFEAMYQGDLSNTISTDKGDIKNYSILLRVGLNFKKLK